MESGRLRRYGDGADELHDFPGSIVAGDGKLQVDLDQSILAGVGMRVLLELEASAAELPLESGEGGLIFVRVWERTGQPEDFFALDAHGGLLGRG